MPTLRDDVIAAGGSPIGKTIAQYETALRNAITSLVRNRPEGMSGERMARIISDGHQWAAEYAREVKRS
jgi:hypothetical protein